MTGKNPHILWKEEILFSFKATSITEIILFSNFKKSRCVLSIYLLKKLTGKEPRCIHNEQQ